MSKCDFCTFNYAETHPIVQGFCIEVHESKSGRIRDFSTDILPQLFSPETTWNLERICIKCIKYISSFYDYRCKINDRLIRENRLNSTDVEMMDISSIRKPSRKNVQPQSDQINTNKTQGNSEGPDNIPTVDFFDESSDPAGATPAPSSGSTAAVSRHDPVEELCKDKQETRGEVPDAHCLSKNANSVNSAKSSTVATDNIPSRGKSKI